MIGSYKSTKTMRLASYGDKIVFSTWKIGNIHVEKKHSPRRGVLIPPKFHLIPPKFYFVSTWRINFSHVEIQKSLRRNHSETCNPL